jgi:hypothetical protein
MELRAARRHDAAMTENAIPLFSYGTLRQENVQMASFGRLLVAGSPDALPGERDHEATQGDAEPASWSRSRIPAKRGDGRLHGGIVYSGPEPLPQGFERHRRDAIPPTTA